MVGQGEFFVVTNRGCLEWIERLSDKSICCNFPERLVSGATVTSLRGRALVVTKPQPCKAVTAAFRKQVASFLIDPEVRAVGTTSHATPDYSTTLNALF